MSSSSRILPATPLSSPNGGAPPGNPAPPPNGCPNGGAPRGKSPLPQRPCASRQPPQRRRASRQPSSPPTPAVIPATPLLPVSAPTSANGAPPGNPPPPGVPPGNPTLPNAGPNEPPPPGNPPLQPNGGPNESPPPGLSPGVVLPLCPPGFFFSFLLPFFVCFFSLVTALDCRRDSFITHRAFCDALAEESARAMAANPLGNSHPLLFSQPTSSHDPSPLPHNAFQAQFPHLMRTTVANTNIMGSHHGLQELSLKREHHLGMRADIPPWLACQGPASLNQLDLPSSFYSTRLEQQYSHENQALHPPPLPPPYQGPSTAASSHMSATALLQKAAQMGATMSRPPHLGQMATHTTNATVANTASTGFGLGLTSHQEMTGGGGGGFGHGSAPPLLQDMMMNSLTSPPGFGGSFEESFGVMLGAKREENNTMESIAISHGMNEEGGTAGAGGGNDGLTRDFLGLRAFSHRDILNMAGFDPCMSSSSYEQSQQNKKPWHG